MGAATIVGSGLLAKAFTAHLPHLSDITIYAAGVSNSSCKDAPEFDRDTQRLHHTIQQTTPSTLFVYFSTCSVMDPWSQTCAYPIHKKKLEDLVRTLDRSLIVRLPQVAGNTPNPHTILNYLFSHIVRSERFDLWRNTTRNIIDVDDVARIVVDFVRNEYAGQETINVANPENSTMFEIVSALEIATRRRAIYNCIDRGGDYRIDISRIIDSAKRCGVGFGNEYLLRTVIKYYG